MTRGLKLGLGVGPERIIVLPDRCYQLSASEKTTIDRTAFGGFGGSRFRCVIGA